MSTSTKLAHVYSIQVPLSLYLSNDFTHSIIAASSTLLIAFEYNQTPLSLLPDYIQLTNATSLSFLLSTLSESTTPFLIMLHPDVHEPCPDPSLYPSNQSYHYYAMEELPIDKTKYPAVCLLNDGKLTRRDEATRLSLEEVIKCGCGGMVSWRHMVDELGFRVGAKGKYGA